MRRLILAFAFLTRVPMPRLEPRDGDFAGAIRWYPLVGLGVGALVIAACWAGGRIDPWFGALLGLVCWVGVTGALHVDGLADVADGLGAAHGDRARMLSVMADPHIGSFGVTAIVLLLAAKLVLLHLVVDDVVAPMLIPFAARIGPLAWARFVPPLRSQGLGATVATAVRTRDVVGWLALLCAAAIVAPAILAALVVIPAFGWWARRRVGGMTGDVHGAGIEVVEVGLLVATLLVRQL